jgi:hypothetical protein
MAHLHRAAASLRIAGKELVPDEITALLGSNPTHAQTKGQEILARSGRTRTPLFGQWRLNANVTEPENLDSQVAELLGKLTTDLTIWRDLAARFDIDLFCGWFMSGGNEGVTIEPKTQLALGERGITLSLDIYGPDAGA